MTYAEATRGFTTDDQYAEFDRLTSAPPIAAPAPTPLPEQRPGKPRILRRLPPPDRSGLDQLIKSGQIGRRDAG